MAQLIIQYVKTNPDDSNIIIDVLWAKKNKARSADGIRQTKSSNSRKRNELPQDDDQFHKDSEDINCYETSAL